MKKFYAINFLLLLCSFGLYGQSQSSVDLALRYLESNAEKWQLTSDDIQDVLVSDMYQSKSNKVVHIYLNQTYQNTPVHGANMSIHLKDGKVIHSTRGFIADIKSKIENSKESINASQAILSAAKHFGITSPSTPQFLTQKGNGSNVYAATNFTNSEIPVQTVYAMDRNGKFVLAHDLSLDLKANADYWSVRIDASSGEVLSQNNWTVYCKHEQNVSHDVSCGHSIVAAVNQSFKSLEEVNSAGSTYSVYALPAESPIHGPFVTVTDPHYSEASPFGWHDTDGADGAEYTITRGNNVYAYLDADATNNEPDGNEPDGGSGLNFEFGHDQASEPAENSRPAQVNLFYLNNMIHDILYLAGFDEVSGNFQANNYGKGGVGNDYVNAECQDASGSNNANFSTPPDGGRGRMQMFLWDNPSGDLSIDRPEDIAGFITEYGTAQFGIPISTTAVTGSVALATDGSPSNPTTTCKPAINPEELDGKVVIVDRGLCDFSLKVFNAQAGGAIAVVICNIAGVNGGTGDEIINMAGGDMAASVTIPSVFMRKSDCDAIRLSLVNGNDVQMTFQERQAQGPSLIDGSFDNGVMAHEFGHGVSMRIVGGPNNTSCLFNPDTDGDGVGDVGEQMGEGWSDFFALVLTHKDGDSRNTARGIGNYVSARSPNGRGIRPFPYTADMSINPMTYDDIKTNSVPHGVGTVWCTMLWDIYWDFVEKYGYDADWRNTESGNFKALKLVIDGMRYTACPPSFGDARDGILTADMFNNDGENELLLWMAFADRGLGDDSESGDPLLNSDGTEGFELPPLLVEKLKITKTATPLVGAGGVIDITLTGINHIPAVQNNVVITDELPDGLTYIDGSANVPASVTGNIITFDLGTMAYKDVTVVTYQVNTDIDNKSQSLYYQDMEVVGEWDIESVNSGTFPIWFPSNITSFSGTTSWFMEETATENDQLLISPTFTILGTNPTVRFWHQFNTEAIADGGFVEVSTDNGNVWNKLEDKFIRNGYSGEIQYTTFAIPALQAFFGTTNGEFIDSYIDMSDYSGMDVKLRFRFGTDDNTIAQGDNPGWFIDDLELLDLVIYKSMACIISDESEEACTESIETVVDSDVMTASDDPIYDIFSMTIFPNPAGDLVNVKVTSTVDTEALIELRSLNGSVMKTQTARLNGSERIINFRTQDLSAGMYLIQITSGSSIQTQKLIIE